MKGEIISIDKAIDVSKVIAAKNRIYQVGIELEGGWDKLKDGVRIIRDGSVHFAGDINQPGNRRFVARRAVDGTTYILDTQTSNRLTAAEYEQMSSSLPAPPKHVGELPSAPLDVKEVPKWIKDYYPHHTNDTCGMHVHMSFMTAIAYSRLMVVSYPATVLAEFVKWAKDEKLPSTHPIWPRLQGESRFCKLIFCPDLQARNAEKRFDQNEDGNRYTMINYCYVRNNTVECRLLPMFETVKIAQRAVDCLLSTTNKFLLATAKREKKVTASIEVDPTPTIKELRACV